jgi:hypothetical protein
MIEHDCAMRGGQVVSEVRNIAWTERSAGHTASFAQLHVAHGLTRTVGRR